MSRRSLPTIWTEPQRRVVFGFAVLLIAAVLVIRWLRPMTIPDSQPTLGSRASELQDKVDPNTADESTLAALPTLGAKRAAEIVAYRQQHPGEIAFHTARDLLKLKGFGVSTVENIQPYITLPPQGPRELDRPTTDH